MSTQAGLIELNRRIAIEVMGDPEPQYAPYNMHSRSKGGCWHGEWANEDYYNPVYVWKPLNFSEVMDLAMRAVDEVLKDIEEQGITGYAFLDLMYWPGKKPWQATIETENWQLQWHGNGDTAPEAICHCLLDYADGA